MLVSFTESVLEDIMMKLLKKLSLFLNYFNIG